MTTEAATEIPNITKAKTVCTCGHDKVLHDMQVQDNLCLQTSCPCWNFTPQTKGGA